MSIFDSMDDTVPEGIKEIQQKFINPTSNQFVVVSDQGGVSAVPLKHFVRRPTIYTSLIDTSSLKVIEIKGKILNLRLVTEEMFDDISQKLGLIDIDLTKDHLFGRLRNIPNVYGAMLYYVIERRIRFGQLTGSRLKHSDVRRRIQHLGYDAIMDIGNIQRGSLIDPKFPALALIVNQQSITILSSHDSSEIITPDTLDEYVYEIVIRISEEVLDSEPNTDDPYVEGADHYYWTFDGMQIRVTESSSNEAGLPAYLFDIETPYGLLYHVSMEDDTVDDIINELRKKYSSMTQPMPNWKPLDRDIFLHNKQLEYKDNSQRVIDLIQEVRKYYPSMREYGKQYKINIKPEQSYSDFDKSLISSIIDTFASQRNAREFINRISNNGDITDVKILQYYFPRKRLPINFEYDDLMKMALVYDIAKKINPNARGWRVFHRYK